MRDIFLFLSHCTLILPHPPHSLPQPSKPETILGLSSNFTLWVPFQTTVAPWFYVRSDSSTLLCLWTESCARGTQ